jgi:elongation factor 3
MTMDANTMVKAELLLKNGFDKHMKVVDERIAARAGMYQRPLTQANVEKHLEDVGLDREFGTHHRIKALSGGQKVKVVLASSMWNQPHILILDEPTNYLDRESLGALAGAIREFEGGVVMISHNAQFCSELCPETWVLEKGDDGIARMDTRGDPEWMANVLKEKVAEKKQEETMTDALGNTVVVKQQKKNLSNKDKKKAAKLKAARRKRGEDVSDDDEDWAGFGEGN